MFTNGMKESNQEVIELKDENISSLGFKVVIDSIYSGELPVNKKNVFEVLTTANHLQMPIIVRQCWRTEHTGDETSARDSNAYVWKTAA